MLQIHSTVRLDEIEPVLRAAAQRHNANVTVISHLGQPHQEGGTGVPRDAFVFTLCHSKLYTALLAADIRFAGFLPCRIAAWPDAGGVMLEAMTPSEYCRVLGRADLEAAAAPLEKALREILEDAVEPAVLKFPTFSGIVTLMRYQLKQTLAVERRRSRVAASMASH